jgi:hypothetical protein
VVGLAFAGLVHPRVEVLLRVAPKIADVPEHVSLGVLRAGVAQVRADAEVGRRRLTHRPTFDRQPAHEGKASAVEKLLADPGKLRRQRRQWEVGLGDAGNVGLALRERPHSALDLGLIGIRQSVNPIAALHHVGPIPDTGPLDRRGKAVDGPHRVTVLRHV